MEELDNLPPDFVATFSRQMKMLKFVGINIFSNTSTNGNFLKKYGRIFFFFNLLHPLFIGQILYIVWNEVTGATFMEIIGIIPVLFVLLQDYVKILVGVLKQNQIGALIKDIGKIWPRDIENETKRDLLKSWTQQLKKRDNAFMIVATTCLSIYLSMPLVFTIYAFATDPNGAKYELPMQLYFFCWLKSKYEYGMAYLYFIVTCASVHLCVYISFDFLLVSLSYDLSALLSLIENDLKNFNTSYPRTPRHDSANDDCTEIKAIAELHQKLLGFASRLNDIFSPAILVQVLFSSVVICCFGFLSAADGMLIRYVVAVFSFLSSIFILAWPGQVLADTSFDISSAAYFSPWYEKSIKFRKIIAFILIRSQKPCYLTAMGYSVATFAMFFKVVSTSWSYLSLLKQMYQDFQA